MNLELDTVYNCDSLELMQEMLRVGLHADWIITDPPYGIGEDGKKNHSRGKLAKATKYTEYDWDKQRVGKEYFDIMRKVSKNQIIFGGNYYSDYLPPSSCWVVWDKVNGNTDFADCELAWCSLNKAVRICRYRWSGMLQGNMKCKEQRIHPTQKPLPVIEWLLKRFTNEGELVLDAFMGSFTTAIACHKLKRHYLGSEINTEYFQKGMERLNAVKAQISIFD